MKCTVKCTLGVLAAAVCLTASPALGSVPPGFSQVVALATNSAELRDRVQVISGDVVVNDAASGPTLGAVELELDNDVTTPAGFGLVADRISIGSGSVVNSEVFYNQLTNNGTINGSLNTPLALPVYASLPPFETGVPGTNDIDVPKNGSVSLPAGDYGILSAKKGATVIFEGGVYNFLSIDVDEGGSVQFLDRAQVRVAETIRIKADGALGPAAGSGIDACRIIFYVAGAPVDDDSDGAPGSAVRFKTRTTVGANFYAPNGKIRIDAEVAAEGAFVGQDVRVREDATLTLCSFFNEPPQPGDDSATVDEGGTVSVLDSGATSVLANDTDPNPGDTLTVTTTPVSGPDHAAAFTLNADGTFSYSHDGSETIADSFVYEVCDDGTPVECSTATVSITINPVNDPPVANDDAATTDEDTATVIDVLGNDSDVDGALDPSSVNVTSGPGFGSTAVNAATGEVTYTPNADQNGEDSFTYQVCDDGVPPPVLCDSATVTVTVNPVNDAPTADAQAVETDTETPITITLTGADIDGDSLAFSIVANPALGTVNAPVSVSPTSAEVTYTPNGDATGADAFTFQVDDGNGGTATAVVDITVILANDPPVANDRSVITDGALSVTIVLSGSDGDLDPLTFSIVTPPTAGSLGAITQISPSSATVVYTPNDPPADAEDSFEFQVDDGKGGTDVGLVSINAGGGEPQPNIPPNADNLSVETLGAASVTLVLTAQDGDGDALTFSILTPPGVGTLSGLIALSPTSAQTTYTPNDPGANFEDSFVFQVDDGNGGLDTGLVSINGETGETPNDPPVANPDSITVNTGATVTVLNSGATSLLANDSDPNGDNLAMETSPVNPGANGPFNGSVTLFANGTFSYTHNGSANASDRFVYRVCDDGTPIECATATVLIAVRPASITVTITKAGTGSGTVTTSPLGINCGSTCSATFGSTTPILLEATPASGSVFAGYSGDADCFDGTLTPNGNKSCTATFNTAPPPPMGDVTITVQKIGAGDGTVSSNPAGIDCGATCSALFPVATANVVLTTAPAAGSTFVGFGGDPDCADGVVRTNLDKTCLANFALLPASTFTLTVVKSGNGDGDVATNPAGIVCGATCSASYEAGIAVALLVRPAAGSSFAGWVGDPDCIDGSVTMDADKTCEAVFNPN